jgi:hypothetical protein
MEVPGRVDETEALAVPRRLDLHPVATLREQRRRTLGHRHERRAKRRVHVELAGVDQDGVRSRHEGVDPGVAPVPLVEGTGHVRRAPLIDPTAGSLPRLGDEIELQRGVREHHRADVAALHHRPVLAQGPLRGAHHRPDLRVLRDGAHVGLDSRGLEVTRGRRAVDQELPLRPGAQREPQGLHESRQSRPVLDLDVSSTCRQGERPVHRPRVHVREPEGPGEEPGEGALPAPRGAVDRDDA